jgi:hypothetical protein
LSAWACPATARAATTIARGRRRALNSWFASA